MIFVRYHCKPTKAHAEYEQTGDTWVNGLIRVRSFAEAKARAMHEIRGRHLEIVGLEEIGRVSREHYSHDVGTIEFLEYYDEAEKAGEVFVYYASVRCPVFCVEFDTVPARSNRDFPRGARATVKYWVLNETVEGQLYSNDSTRQSESYTDFWGHRKHRDMAVKLGRKKIRDYGWRVTNVCGGGPVSYDDYQGNALFREYYDETEECGECTAFWIDALSG